jgi:hypothetical protein
MNPPSQKRAEAAPVNAMKGAPLGTPFTVEPQLAAPSKLLTWLGQYTQIALRPIVAWFFFAMPLSSLNGSASDES